MNSPNVKQLNAFVRLQNDDDFQVFLGWVTESMTQEAMLSVSMGKEPERTWMQGRVQQLNYLLGAVKDARSTLEMIEKSREG